MPRVKTERKKFALDTETTGVDLRHGCRPFIVTTCFENGEQRYWEWDVIPTSRLPIIPSNDLKEIVDLLRDDTYDIVLQNSKFDVLALSTILLGFEWPWERTYDTLIGSHLLHSLAPKSLDALSIQYLGIDIAQYEKRMREVCIKARNKVSRSEEYKDWIIAKEGIPSLPSVKQTAWKNDTWLPKLLWQHGEGEDSWETVTIDYANTDSACTLGVWNSQEEMIKRRDLWKIFKESMRVVPVIYSMESFGISVNGNKLNEAIDKYRKESESYGRVCYSIAESYGYDLKLPKSGVNKSLNEFAFEILELPALKRSKRTGAPSLDAEALSLYSTSLPRNSKQLLFVKKLADKRKCDTALSYMESYKRFWVANPNHEGYYRLYPALNQTGTQTLRFSSSNPNEQNISKKEGFNLRQSFGPDPDREWFVMDAENIELRIPSYTAMEQAMIDLFERPNDPPFFGSNHLLVFSILHPTRFNLPVCPKCLCTDQERRGGMSDCDTCEDSVPLYSIYGGVKKKYASTWYQWTKNGNFAVQYGAMKESGTADRAYHVEGGQELIESKFTETAKLNKELIEYSKRTGYVETLPDKSVDPENGYPLMVVRTDYGQVKPTIPLNYFVQGTAMWWMRRSMVKVHDYLEKVSKETGEVYKIVMQVHDEMVFDFPRGETYHDNLKIAVNVKKLMESCGDDIGIPIPVSIEYTTTSWDETIKIPKEDVAKCLA